jgi:hypothetical protein
VDKYVNKYCKNASKPIVWALLTNWLKNNHMYFIVLNQYVMNVNSFI